MVSASTFRLRVCVELRDSVTLFLYLAFFQTYGYSKEFCLDHRIRKVLQPFFFRIQVLNRSGGACYSEDAVYFAMCGYLSIAKI